MKLSVQKRMDQIEKDGYELDFATVLNDAIESFKKTFLWSGLAMFILCVFIVILTIGILLAVFGSEALTGSDISAFDFNFTDPLQIGLYLLAAAIMSGLMAPFTAGFLELPKAHDTQQDFAFDTVFKYYGSRKFGNLFLLGLIIALISSSIGMGNEFLSYPGFQFVNMVFNFLFGLFTMLAIPFVIYADANPLQALSMSVTVIQKQFWNILGLYIVAVFAALCGLIACCIGVIFTMPIVYSMIISIYKHSIGFHDQENDINFHQTSQY